MAEKPTYEELEQRIRALEDAASDLRSADDERYRSLFNNAAVGMFRMDTATGKAVDVNEVGAKLFGYSSRADLVADYIAAEHYADPLARESLLEVLANEGQVNGMQIHYVRRDGTRFWGEYTGFLLDGGPVVDGFIIDVTESKRAEEALRESEERHREFLENYQGIAYQSEYRTFSPLLFSGAVEEITGYAPEEFLSGNLKWTAVIHPDDLQSFLDEGSKFATDHDFISAAEYRVVRKDGGVRFLRDVARLVDINGTPTIQGTVVDITESRLAEEELNSIFRLTPDLIGVADANSGHFKRVNPAWETILGHPIEEFMSRPFREFIHPEDQDATTREVTRQQDGDPVFGFVNRYRTRDGSYRSIEWHASEAQADGTVYATGRDITERIAAQSALEVSEKRYNALFSGITDGVLVHHITEDGGPGQIIDANDIACKMLGYRREELIGLGIGDIDAPESTVDVFRVVNELRAGRDVLFEQIHKAKDGRRVPVEVHAQTFQYGDRLAILSTVRDISERKEAQKELADSEEQLRAVFENASDGILLADVETRTFYECNERLCQMLGYDRESLIGMQVSDIHPEEDLAYVVDLFDAQARGEITLAEDVPCLRKDGSVFYADINTARVGIRDGNYNVGFFRDITARREEAKERERLENELRQAQKMEAIGTLAGGIAHDFNNVLGIILGNAELAIEDVPNLNPARDCLREIRKAALRARDMVRQILSFSRQSLGERKPLSVTPIIEETLKFLRSTIPTSIEIHSELSAQEDTVLADPAQVGQILMNLCTNSVHAMGDGGLLEISLRNVTLDESSDMDIVGLPSGDYLELAVRDSGNGMEPALLERIFDPYFTTKESGEGTGLGLSVVDSIVRRYDGRISVQSELGKGTAFEVYLPLTGEEADEGPAESDAAPTGTGRVLLVDDEEGIVKTCSLMLESLGYDVVSYTDAEEALADFTEDPQSIDLIITDMTMPKMNGDKLTREARKVRNVPVILCSGYSGLFSADEAADIGISAFVMKPVVKGDIARTIRSVLDGDRATAR